MLTILRIFVFVTLMGSLALSFAADPAAGKGKTAACGGCHGADGNSVAPTFPRLAGQNMRYLKNQLSAFKSGARENEMMQPMAANLSEKDMEDISAYYAAQEQIFSTDDEQYLDEDEDIEVTDELIAAGKKFYRGGNTKSGAAACTGCHGPDGSGNEPAGFPMVKGQYALVIAKALRDFKSGQRSSDTSTMMPMIAKKMTDEEINAVASYISSMR